MRTQTFTELQTAYYDTNHGLDNEVLEERSKLLKTHRYSLIVEGEYSELENLKLWISEHTSTPKEIYYGKTDYDFGFVEYFFEDEANQQWTKQIVPLIFTSYPLALNPNTICRSNGYSEQVDYDPEMKNAIIFP